MNVTNGVVGAQRSWPGVLVASVISLVFVLRALVPVGYMWAPVAGHVAVVACADYAPDVISAALHSHHHHGGDHSAAAQNCPFALPAGAALAAMLPALAKPNFQIVAAPTPDFDQSEPRVIPLRFRAARGPPIAV